MSDERGFLTPTDRRFLQGEKEYTGENAKQNRYHRREGIAGRTRQAFRDFALLYQTLDERERERVFDVDEYTGRLTESWADDVTTDFEAALTSTIAFLYRSLEGDAPGAPGAYRVPFRWILETGIQRAEVDRQPPTEDTPHGPTVSVSLDVDVLYPTQAEVESAVDKMGVFGAAQLSGVEARTLLQALDPDRGEYEGGYNALVDQIRERRQEAEDRRDRLRELSQNAEAVERDDSLTDIERVERIISLSRRGHTPEDILDRVDLPKKEPDEE